MGATATDEKQTLEDQLAEARALIEGGAYAAGLGVLEDVRDAACVQQDAGALSEVHKLAGTVAYHVPSGTRVGDHAGALVAAVTFDLDPDAVADSPHPSWQPAPGLSLEQLAVLILGGLVILFGALAAAAVYSFGGTLTDLIGPVVVIMVGVGFLLLAGILPGRRSR